MNSINPMNIPGLQQIAAPMPGVGASGNEATASSGFKNLLMESLQNVNEMQMQADHAVETLFTGGDVNPAEVLTAVQKADLAFRMTMQLRNKVMDVYQEVKDIRI